MPPRGELDRLIVTQTSGDPEAATINVYDRKGACIAATDLNVAESGVVLNFGVGGATTTLTFLAAHHLQVGDQFEVKGATNLAYNGTHTVLAVVSNIAVRTDVVFTEEQTGGLWQTLPFDPTNKPITHLVLTANITSGEDYIAFDINRAYENKDNRSETMRSRHSALWLEFLTVGAVEPSDWQVAYTCRADAIV
jgi:hypothetical protein